ncbi:MAG: hypothetical protein ACUZ8E_01770 [Candidatus Anammoxibacter sp.]
MRDIIDKISFINAMEIVASGDTTNTGLTIDRDAHGWPNVLSFLCIVGAETGSPTSVTIICKIQDSADDSSWADVDDIDEITIIADNAVAKLDVDAQKYRRYVRTVMTVLFVGGTSPDIMIAAVCIGGEKKAI